MRLCGMKTNDSTHSLQNLRVLVFPKGGGECTLCFIFCSFFLAGFFLSSVFVRLVAFPPPPLPLYNKSLLCQRSCSPPPSTCEPAHGPFFLLSCLPFPDPPGILSIAFLLESSTTSLPYLPSGGSVLLLHFSPTLPTALAFPPCHPVGMARQAVFGLGAYRVIPQPHGENLRDQGGFFHAGHDSVVDL